jgi:FkbM family methyltransferase
MKNIFRFVKRVTNTIRGMDLFVKLDCQCECKRFGSEYGGWDVVSGYLNDTSIIYSFGVGEDASFDLELMRETGAMVYAFDPTPRSIQWVRDQSFPSSFIMHEYGILDFDGFVTFIPPRNPNHVSHTVLESVNANRESISVPVKKLKSIMEILKHDKVDILKMDIEGAEYSVIKDMKLSGIRPTQLLIEFHHRFYGVGARETKEAIMIIKEMGYKLFSVSKSGEEYSFIQDRYLKICR